jgi:phosphoribosylformylglycinamidine cyclo-ligase
LSKQNIALNYLSSGVNIDAGNELVKRIQPLAQLTARSGVLGSIGNFSGLFELPINRYREPVLVASTDGVGTKLKLAPLDTVGIDLVAMCVNDIITCGAEPLFFLDYYATGLLKIDDAEQVIRGIVTGCKLANCALIGGETAEMPGMYAVSDYDIAGFTVGIVEKSAILGTRRVKVGDALIGIASSGPHSNGYSLIRKILELNVVPNEIMREIVAPTRIYVKSILELLSSVEIHAIAHITGGGITENLPRILPTNTTASINLATWNLPNVFNWLQMKGNISQEEMLRVFNCGVGMIIAIPENEVDIAIQKLQCNEETAWRIGQVEASTGNSSIIYI